MFKIIKPFKFKILSKVLKSKSAKVLDIGCGNHSPSLTKYWFPNCIYYGLDKDKNYNNNSNDLELIDGFYQIDLSIPSFEIIPDNFFDVIIMSHIIEHLFNGEEVITKLLPKLKQDGYLYVEYPSFKSTRLPSMKGTLNFFDDPTHCRIYSQPELYNFFLKNNVQICKGGVRRAFVTALLTPVRSLFDLIRFGYINGSVFWDLTGFANFILAQKK